MSDRLRVLCLDIEGGHGGSSRSLYFLLKHLDRAAASVEVWCRRDGPIHDRYRALRITTVIEPSMPKASALPRFSRNAWQAIGFAHDWLSAASFRRRLRREVADRFDLVHFNHEALAGLAWWLRRGGGPPAVMHIRTNLHDSMFARAQTRLIDRAVDRRVFITPNEEANYRRLGGHGAGRVVFNVVEPPAAVAPHAGVALGQSLGVACLSNYSWLRGIDRLVDVAVALREAKEQRVHFVIAGDMRLAGSLPGSLGAIARRGGSLAEYAAQCGVEEMFTFLGHVAEPETVLAASHVLIKPTREGNPWGRDILEAMAAGRPVASVGRDATFVETGVTGLLQSEFDARSMAAWLSDLAGDRDRLERLGAAAARRVLDLCDGRTRASELLATWREAAGRR